ncbi:hypothetical protein HDU96_000294, partial [Phlyctochytrium bullatum]
MPMHGNSTLVSDHSRHLSSTTHTQATRTTNSSPVDHTFEPIITVRDHPHHRSRSNDARTLGTDARGRPPLPTMGSFASFNLDPQQPPGTFPASGAVGTTTLDRDDAAHQAWLAHMVNQGIGIAGPENSQEGPGPAVPQSSAVLAVHAVRD